KKMVPCYTVINETGPDHDKTFTVQLTVKEMKTEGIGKSIKLAEQDAAEKALKMINEV
ncbi:MAG: ribonuclease III, partial [Desulfobacterales bacterium]|nr:ribonuclease III [Desulfobacterales bacterium]